MDVEGLARGQGMLWWEVRWCGSGAPLDVGRPCSTPTPNNTRTQEGKTNTTNKPGHPPAFWGQDGAWRSGQTSGGRPPRPHAVTVTAECQRPAVDDLEGRGRRRLAPPLPPRWRHPGVPCCRP